MPVRGLRGAITVEQDTPEAVLSATRELLDALCAANSSLKTEDIASVFFTTTADLSSVFPAQAARQLGWRDPALMCAQEIIVSGSLPACVRVLIHWNTDLPQAAVKPVYLRAAACLRPDLVNNFSEATESARLKED